MVEGWRMHRCSKKPMLAMVVERGSQGPLRTPEDLPLALSKKPRLKVSSHHYPCSGRQLLKFSPNHPVQVWTARYCARGVNNPRPCDLPREA